MPLNLLPAGETLPLIAYFQGPVPNLYAVTAELEFYLPVMPDDDRYLPVENLDESVTYNQDGDIAYLTGTLSLPTGLKDAQYTWVSAAALDADGHIVAVRRWDAANPLKSGSELPFELTLYSFAGEIEQVIFLAEAQPEMVSGD